MTNNPEVPYSRAAAILKAIAHPDRLQIIGLLEGGDISVGALGDQLEIPQPTISHHLAVLRRQHLVQSRRIQTAVLYSLVHEPRALALIAAALAAATPAERPERFNAL